MKDLPQQWQGARVSILGVARSGMALGRVLAGRGARVLLSDQRPEAELGSLVEEARSLGMELEMGGHSPRLLECDALLISPGVSLYSDWVQRALEAGVPVAGEVEIAYRLGSKPLLAVTGTNGKSTTCSLLQAALGRRGRLAGNIGIPLVSEVTSELPGVDYVVAEISSFQLETVHTFRPHLAVLTNITPDHLDRHRTMQEYVRAKARLFAFQQASDWALFNFDDPAAEMVSQWVARGEVPAWPPFPSPGGERPQVLGYTVTQRPVRGAWLDGDWIMIDLCGSRPQRFLRWEFPNLPGPHNLSNGVAAALAAACVGASAEEVSRAFAGYQRMHHRLEEVGRWAGKRFIDDSKATNVSSVESALQTYREPIVLIAGGRDKGLDLEELGRVIAAHCHALVVIGEAGPRIAEASARNGMIRIESAPTLDEAVRRAAQLCPDPGVVLLSPACTSFDMFRNAEHRGEEFAASVRRWLENTSALAGQREVG